jgi:hypothetical protein
MKRVHKHIVLYIQIRINYNFAMFSHVIVREKHHMFIEHAALKVIVHFCQYQAVDLVELTPGKSVMKSVLFADPIALIVEGN